MKKHYLLYHPLLLLITILLTTSLVFSQEKTITGTVIDADSGEPLPGVTIRVEEVSGVGTITDANGTFSLNVPSEAHHLIFSYVGYNTQTLPITASQMTVKLQQGKSLEEVVVVGYGTQKAKDVSSAITNISAEDFNNGVITSPVQQIQGKVAGVVITRPNGDPNANASIRLRGQVSLTGGQAPLVVLNGVPLDDPNQIANIPPGDIASYNILKDASATAIYGSRGANGVIIINTKKGQAGKTRVTYSGYIGIDHISNTYNMLNASEWKAVAKQVGTDQATIDNYDKGGNTDWLDAITRTAISNSHTLSISGGTDRFTYYGSVNYIDQQGIVVNSGKNEVGLHFTAEQKALDDKLDIKIGIMHTRTNRKYTDYNIFMYAYNVPPVYPVYNEDGSYFAFSDFNQANPVMHQMEQLNTGNESMTIMHGTIDYELVPGLKIGATGSLSYFNKQTDWFQPSFPVENNFNNGNKYNENRNSKKGNLHINYLHDWGKHNFSLTLVHEYNDFTFDHFQASGQQYPVEQNQNNALENGNPQFNKISSYKEEYQLASFLGRVTYNYNNKYYLVASLRRDGSSKFGINNRWGNFPAISGAWRISDENFMRNITWINSIKLKAGYGVTGNQDAIDAYRSQQLLGTVGRYYDAASSRYPQAFAPTQNANPDLKWEEVRGINVGIDFSLFNNRLSGNLNWFHKKTENLLYNYTVPVPPFYVNTILANIGELVNKGLGAQINANIVQNKNFTWTLSGQISFIKTTITSLSGSYAGFNVSTDNVRGGVAQGRGLSDYPITFLKVGYAPYTFFLPHYLGVDDNGSQLFSDGKGGKVTQGSLNTSMYHYINPSPDFTYGISNTFHYNNWGLTFFLRGVSGQKVFDNTLMILSNINRMPGNNVTSNALDNGIKDAAVASDLWLEDASYLRLSNLSLSYSFKDIPFLQSLQVYIAGNNLFVITPYKGLDPEVHVTDSNQSYIDATNGTEAYYPRSRSFSFGVNVAF